MGGVMHEDEGRDKASRTRRGREVWTLDAVRRLGLVTDIPTAASILHIGRTKAYELARADEFPVHLLRVGRRYVVPVSEILRMLGVAAGVGD
jgi:hypothetical protein